MAALRPHDHDAVVLASGLDHPLAFVDEHGHRLFDVDVLARRASHDGEQCVPVVRRRDHDALDILVLIHLAEIAIALGVRIRDVLQPFVEARLVDVADAHQVDVGELLEIRDVLFPDQSESDKPDADAVVGAKHALVRRGRQRSRPHKSPPRGLRIAYFHCHTSRSLRDRPAGRLPC